MNLPKRSLTLFKGLNFHSFNFINFYHFEILSIKVLYMIIPGACFKYQSCEKRGYVYISVFEKLVQNRL